MGIFSTAPVNVYRANGDGKQARPTDLRNRIDKAPRAGSTIRGSYKKNQKNNTQEATVYAQYKIYFFHLFPNGDWFF